MTIEVLATGALTTVQDRGRSGWAALGVPRSGAFDRGAAALANRLVGNVPAAAVLEITLGGLHVRVDRAATVALAGAACPGLDWGAAVTVPAGTDIRLATPATGLRSYLAVRGGIDVRPVLGARATDTLSGLGPPPLRPGDRLAVGDGTGGAVGSGFAAARPGRREFRVVLGPREDWFAADAPAILLSSEWTVRGESDRVGIRLDGPPLARRRDGELPSEAMLPGVLQVPPDGRPILFGPDCPVTGGYPVLAVVRDADLDAAAQLRPGDTIRFTG